MKIKSNASPDEISSPFFKANQTFCSDFEHYIASKNGKVKGNYNAWSYLIFGKLTHPKPWNLMYKKSTFTSSGNLLMSSKYQSLLEMVLWETDLKNSYNTEFEIRKKKLFDVFKIPLIQSLSKLKITNNYVINIKKQKSELASRLITILKPLFDSGEIYKVEHRNDKLKIELRSEHHHFDIVDQLLEL